MAKPTVAIFLWKPPSFDNLVMPPTIYLRARGDALMNFQKMVITALILYAFCVALAQAATTTPPRFRIERIPEWNDNQYSVSLLLKQSQQVGVLGRG